ncbi:hypothetical protein [uncultured Pelagibacterium sp.]|uniref:hypothetical protein n=1 Tax=uncultured Pelagibacterium sp. TaxID=1159875 RepID=UPI0030DB0F04
MKLNNIPDDHHVVRHCKRKFLIRNGEEIVGVHPDFLYLRREIGGQTGPETYLSAFYFEFFAGDDHKKAESCAAALPFGTKGGAMVRLNAGSIRDQGNKHQVKLRVTHEYSNKSIPSKARIDGMPLEPHLELAAAICGNSIVSIHSP